MISRIPKEVWKNINTVLVDFDGTLADSHPRLYTAYKNFMELNNRTATVEEFNELVGPTMPEIVRTIIRKHNLKSTPEDLLASYNRILELLYAHEVDLYPNAVDVLEYLKNQRLTIAMVTSADRSLVEPFLKRHNIFHYFKLIVAPAGNIPGKPAPDLYNLALRELGIQFTQAIVIEDSSAGIASSTSAGIFTIFLQSLMRTKLKKDHFNVIQANDWKDVLRLFKEAGGSS